MNQKDNISNKKNKNQKKADQQDLRIIDLEKQLQEWEEKYKRALADYHNLEKRFDKEKKEVVKLANRWLIERLLEPLDFMMQATKHTDDKGVQMVVDRFFQVLQEEGLEKIQVLGKEFNEETMEAVESDKKENTNSKKSSRQKLIVQEVVSPGYMLNGHVIRHAKVVVSNG